MTRRARLFAFGILCLLLAACSGNNPSTEVTTADDAVEETDAGEFDELRVDSGSDSDEFDLDGLDADELTDVQAVIPDAPVVTSPAGRQDAQRVDGVEPDADAEPESGLVADSGVSSGSSVATSDSQAPPVAPAPVGPVIDVPIPTQGESSNSAFGGPSSGTPDEPFVSLGEPVVDRTADSCGAGCEVGGLDAGSLALEDVDLSDEPAAETEPSLASLIPEEDAICPEGAAADCIDDASAALVDGGVEGTFASNEAAADPEPDCDARPWMRGCDGPVPEPGDFEPQPLVEDEDESEPSGVQVPQEVQDELLAPLDD